MLQGRMALKDFINLIPPNIRQVGYDIFGGSGDFTEKDLSLDYKAELKGIANKALMKGKDTINYADYDQGTIGQSLIKNLFSKNYNLKTLLGQSKITINENGEMVVTDKFDFNDAQDINSLADVKSMFSGIISAWKGEDDKYAGGIYSAIREGVKWLGSGPGEGSDLKINLGKADSEII